MPYKNVWESQGVYRKYNGIVTGKEIREAVEDVEADSRFDSIRYVINDFLEVAEQVVSPQDIQIIAAIDKVASQSNPNIQIAIVATEQGIQDMASLYQGFSGDSPFETKIFLIVDDARDWLGHHCKK